MEFESTEIIAQVYETLKNINLAISRLQDRSVGINSVNDYLMSPTGMEKLDAACMVLIALGESVKTLDKLTEKKLLPTYPSIDWKGVMGVRDIIAHHYFEVDAEVVLLTVKEDIPLVKSIIDQMTRNKSDIQRQY